MKTDVEILFSRMRNEINPVKSKKFMDWVKQQFPDKDLHHILGSYCGRKGTDLLIVPIEHFEHIEKAHKNMVEYFERCLPISINLLVNYVNEIEKKKV